MPSPTFLLAYNKVVAEKCFGCNCIKVIASCIISLYIKENSSFLDAMHLDNRFHHIFLPNTHVKTAFWLIGKL